MIIGFIGGIGCLSYDTIININRGKKGNSIKIKDLHERQSGRFINYGKSWNKDIPTKVRSFNGKNIQLHEIISTKYSGIKSIYELILSDNKKLRATKEHKIMTDKGYIELQNLNLNHKIMIDTLKPQKNKKISYKLVDTKINAGFHPHKQNHNTVPVHILTYEAYINNLSFIDYMDILWNDKKKTNSLKFVDRKKYVVHHINENHYDNSKANLKIETKKEHSYNHSNEAESFKNFNQGIPKFVKIKRLPVYIGDEKTYDIICKKPYHNFVANGIVVHNSGKTLTMTKYLLQNYMKGYDIYSNYGLKFPKNIAYGKIIPLNKQFFEDYKKSGLDLMRSSIAIDECHVFIDSRSSMSSRNKLFSKFITQSRKREVDLYYTTQEISVANFFASGQVDLRLRKLTDYIIFCSFLKIGENYYVVNEIYYLTKKIGTKIIHANKMFNCYDTNEIIDIDD